MIARFDSEERFRNRLKEGINLFTGAGFSVEAENIDGNRLPIGNGLLSEIKEKFPTVKDFPNLSKASTVLEATCKEQFHEFLSKRFNIGNYNEKYKILSKINIKNIYTTNIDNLVFKIYENSLDRYLNVTTVEGTPFHQGQAVNYSPLHGCISYPNKGYIFSNTKIASAFADQKDDWNNLRNSMSKEAILFWGWNFEDSDVIEALYSGKADFNKNYEKWILLYEPKEYEIEFFTALDFKIIIGTTCELLEKISEINGVETEENDVSENFYLEEYSVPKNESQIASYPLISFFEGDSPRWSHIFSSSICKTHYYSVVSDYIDQKKNIFVIGIPASGKTTLMMQLLYSYPANVPKHYLNGPSINEIKLYLKKVDGRKCMLFLDDCFRDYNVVVQLLQNSNIQLVCFDRDYIYESQAYRIRNITNNFEICDITEINELDARKIVDSIPAEIKKKNTTIYNKDQTIFSILTKNMKKQRFEIRFGKMVSEFYNSNPTATELFVMICYVHSCGVPVSYDMIYSYLRDVTTNYEQVYKYIEEVGKIVCECSDESFAFLNVNFDAQDYYQSRSRYFAELIIRNLPDNISILKKVLTTFINNVPSFKVCRFDIFKRNGFNADYALKAFSDIEEGSTYYEKCAGIDETEYIYQQAALYFSKKKKHTVAFQWIERARNFSSFNKFSVDNTHATIQFNANINIEDEDGSVENLLVQSLDILKNCYTNDRRKSIHVKTFGSLVKQFYERFGYEKSITYVQQACDWLSKEKDSLDYGYKMKNEIQTLYFELAKIINSNQC